MSESIVEEVYDKMGNSPRSTVLKKSDLQKENKKIDRSEKLTSQRRADSDMQTQCNPKNTIYSFIGSPPPSHSI